jgi:transposase
LHQLQLVNCLLQGADHAVDALRVLRTIKKTYACQHCDPNVVAPEQRLQAAGLAEVGPIAKGLCGPGLLAHAIPAKFADPTPLHRLAGQLARRGRSARPAQKGLRPL